MSTQPMPPSTLPKSTQYASLLPILGSTSIYPKGTLFLDNGDGTCSPQGGTERYAPDSTYFFAYDPANPAPLPGQTFWSLDGQGNVIQVGNDGSTEAIGLIRAGMFWFTQAAAQNALQSLQQTPKQ